MNFEVELLAAPPTKPIYKIDADGNTTPFTEEERKEVEVKYEKMVDAGEHQVLCMIVCGGQQYTYLTKACSNTEELLKEAMQYATDAMVRYIQENGVVL